MATVLLIVYCCVIVAASLIGGWLPSLLKLTHIRMQVMMSFVGGLMMGVAVLHLIPHGLVQAEIASTHALDHVAAWTLFGLLAMFFMIRIFHVHQHADHGAPHEHDESCEHDHDHHHPPVGARGASLFGLFLGLALHTLIDGVALAASVASEEAGTLTTYGLVTFIAIALHKPLDALSITSIMAASGWSSAWRNGVNITFALMCPLGALVFHFGVAGAGTMQHLIVGCALAFAAGVFLCIALADILPEVQFHEHDRTTLSVALLAGVLAAWCIGFLEPEHAHGSREPHEHPRGEHSHPHDEHGHPHEH